MKAYNINYVPEGVFRMKNKQDFGRTIKIKSFEQYLRLRRYSDHTIRIYTHYLRKIKTISTYNIKFLLRRYRSPNVYFALNLYCKFAKLKNYLEFLQEHKPIRKADRPPIKVLSDDEFNRIEAYLKTDQFIKHKWSDEFLLLWNIIKATGLRLGTTLSIRISDIDLNKNELLVVTKRSKRLNIKLNPELTNSILTFYRRYYRKPNGKLFRKHYRTYQKYFTIVGQEALGKSIHAHQLRHYFAVLLLRQSNNIRLVQRALGHSKIDTTAIYLDVTDEVYFNELSKLQERLLTVQK